MNRIELRNQSSENQSGPQIELDGGLFTSSSSCPGKHTIFAPMHYERNYAYPLLVWLHGHGGDERQLRRIMPLISMRNYVAVAPRGVLQADGSKGFTWGSSAATAAESAHRVFECVDAVKERFNIADHRVFLAGCDCGGTMAFRIALQYPGQFAGALTVGGPFPADGNPLSELRRARRLPLFIAQGRESNTYPLDRTCEELCLFHAAGLSVTLRQYPGGDELSTQILHDIDVWVMEQVTGVPSEADRETSEYLDLN